MKCSLGISNFLEEISSLSHSIVFLYFFALSTEEGFLISPCYSLELCIQMGISFLLSFAFCFSSFLSYCKASSDNHFVFLHFFSWGWSWSLPPVQRHKPPSIVLQALCLSYLIPWIYFSHHCSDKMWSTGEGNGKQLQYSCHLFLVSSASVRSIPFLSFIGPDLHEMFPCLLSFSWRDL